MQQEYNISKRKPIYTVYKFFDYFNEHNLDGIVDLYSETAVNWQVAEEPLNGKTQIR